MPVDKIIGYCDEASGPESARSDSDPRFWLVIVAEANSGQRCTCLGGVIWSYIRITTVPSDKILKTSAVCRF